MQSAKLLFDFSADLIKNQKMRLALKANNLQLIYIQLTY